MLKSSGAHGIGTMEAVVKKAAGKDPRVLEKLAYVVSSGQREKVLAAVIPGPKTPAQVAEHTGLRLPHVSRTLAQLQEAGLVTAIGPGKRGRLVVPSDLGNAVFEALVSSRGDRLVVPLARGSHFRNYHHWIQANHGKAAADEVLTEMGIDASRIDVDGWYPLRIAMDLLEIIERRFGDGSYETIRRMLREEALNFSSVKRLAARLLPFPFNLELSPNAYAREFNHGRLEVEVDGRRALMRFYDWMSSPARCKAWQGTVEGSLASIGVSVTVTKVACRLKGSAYCGYAITW